MVEKSLFELADLILVNYPLCGDCLGRQFPSLIEKDDKLKRMIKGVLTRKKRCFICQGIMQSLKDVTSKIIKKLGDYEFDNFLIGATLPREVIENEDELRAKFKLRGGEAIKGKITKEIGKTIASKTGKEVNFRNPDVTILMNFTSGKVIISSKPVFVYGRYLKTVRGLSQKRRKCKECVGKRCNICSHTGFLKEESIEQILAQRLIDHFKAKKAKFTWIGGESVESLVLGNGRPFYVEIREPKLRHFNTSCIPEFHKGIILREIRVVDRKPNKTPSFIVTVSAYIRFIEDVDECKINILKKALQNTEVKVKTLKKIFTKKIFDFDIERIDKRRAKISFKCEGGLNIKMFIGISNLLKRDIIEISPNISKILGVEVVCYIFDILNLEIIRQVER